MSVIIEFLIRKQTCNTQGNTKKSTKVFTGIYPRAAIQELERRSKKSTRVRA